MSSSRRQGGNPVTARPSVRSLVAPSPGGRGPAGEILVVLRRSDSGRRPGPAGGEGTVPVGTGRDPHEVEPRGRDGSRPRTHRRLGARTPSAAPAPRTVTVAERERRAGTAFPEPGGHAVPDGLGPLRISRSADQDVHREPDVRMRHGRRAVPRLRRGDGRRRTARPGHAACLRSLATRIDTGGWTRSAGLTRYVVRLGSTTGSPSAMRPAAYSSSHSAVGRAA